jgi:hypothetical protein
MQPCCPTPPSMTMLIELSLPRPRPYQVKPSTISQCIGLYNEFFGSAIFFFGRLMLHTGRHLLGWARENEVRVAAYDVVLLTDRVTDNWKRYQVTCVNCQLVHETQYSSCDIYRMMTTIFKKNAPRGDASPPSLLSFYHGLVSSCG